MATWQQTRRRLLWGMICLIVALIGTYALMLGLMLHWVARPPEVPELPPIARQKTELRGARVYLGRNWFERRDGLPVLYLTGTPFEMGFANGALTQQLIHRQEDTMLGLLHQVAPYRWLQFLLKFFVTYKNRHLNESIPAAYRLEVFGMTCGNPDPHPEVGPAYHRALNYHAAQDISYMMMNSPLWQRACTGFSAWGDQTRDGHLLVGRNFDWEAAPVFDEDRVVIICEPDEGIPFISLAWGGMAGCVSAMNREGLAIFVNGAPSELPGEAATPTCIVARDVVQHAQNLAQAVEIVERHRVFVSAMFLVSSRQDGRSIVIEKTPEQTAVRDSGQESYVVCANHYLTPMLAQEPINLSYISEDTSITRYARLKELLERHRDALTTGQAAALLRDRQLPGDRDVGNGHRGALNPLIATHSVIMDLTDGVFWAATPPHQLGRFIAFDVSATERLLPELVIAADPLLTNGEYQRYLVAETRLDEGWKALAGGRAAEALAGAEAAERDNAGFYRNAWLRAACLRALGRRPEALAACEAALSASPALGSERKKIEALRRELLGAP